jgi:son of sevenless
MARQLTIMEYQLFMKVRPMECILRSREQRAGKVDHISALIQSTNLVSQIRLWLFSGV